MSPVTDVVEILRIRRKHGRKRKLVPRTTSVKKRFRSAHFYQLLFQEKPFPLQTYFSDILN